MKVLIPGAKGFIGAELARMLVNRDHTVVAVEPSTSAGRLSDIGNSLSWRKGDASSLPDIRAIMEETQPDAVVYAPFFRASEGRPVHETVVAELGVMVHGLAYVLDLCENLKVQRVIFPSSTAVHGSQSSADPEVDELSRVRPQTIYGSYKSLVELMVRDYNQRIASNVCIAARIPSVYGPGARVGSREVNVPAVSAAHGRRARLTHSANQRVCLAHVSDVAAMLLELLEAHSLNHDLYEVGGHNASFEEIVGAVEDSAAVDVEFGEGAPIFLPHRVSSRRAETELSLVHRPLKEGMLSVVEYERRASDASDRKRH